MNASEPLMRCRKKLNDVKTGDFLDARISLGETCYCPGGIRHRGGMTLIQALVGNVGSCRSMSREKSKWKHHEDESTNAGTVTEWPVVAMKARNWAGAKGLHCPALFYSQPLYGRNY